MVSAHIRAYIHHMSVFTDILRGGILAAFITLPAQADDHVKSSDPFENIIEAQIAAFARDDDRAAFSLASPDIQRIFGSAEQFMQMVRSSFKPVYRPRSYRFEEPLLVDGQHAQPVSVIGPDGRGVIALYRMQEQSDGSWRIAGVTLHPVNERGI